MSEQLNQLEKEYLYPYGRIECPFSMAVGPVPAPSLLLKTALFRGDTKGVIKAIQDGANAHLVSHDSRSPFITPVWIALSLGYEEIAYFLLRNEPKPARPMMRREFAMACRQTTTTPVSMEHLQAVVAYFGPDIVCRPLPATSDAFTPYHYACSPCHWPLIQYLVGVSQQQQEQPQQEGVYPHWATQKATLRQLTPLHVLRNNKERPDDLAHFLAWILEQEETTDQLFVQDTKGTTALEAILQHTDIDTRNFIVTWMVTTGTRR